VENFKLIPEYFSPKFFIFERYNKIKGKHNSRKDANCKAIRRSFNWDTNLARLGQKTSSSIHSRTRTRFEGAADFDPKPRSGSSIRGYHSFSLPLCQRRHTSPARQFAKQLHAHRSFTFIFLRMRL
jgi:hypothetical protein